MRWTFTDPTTDPVQTYTFERNPKPELTSPHPTRSTTGLAFTIDGRARAHRTQTPPVEWVFSGDIRTQTQHDAFAAWAAKDHRIHVTDHYGRTWETLLLAFEPTEQRPTQRTPWKFTYRMRGLVYRRVQ